MSKSAWLSRGFGLGGVSTLAFAPLVYGVVPSRFLGVNVWLLAGTILTIGLIAMWTLKALGESPPIFPRLLPWVALITMSIVFWATLIMVLRQQEGFSSPKSFSYLLSPLLILFLLLLARKVPDRGFIIGLRASGIVLGCAVLALQTLIHVDLIGDSLTLIEPTRQMVFQANSIGTTLAMLMLLEIRISASSIRSQSISFVVLALHMSAILYVDSDASVVFGLIIMLWFLVSQRVWRNLPKYWSISLGVFLLLLGTLKIRIPSFWISMTEFAQNVFLPDPSKFSIGLRFVDRATSGEGVLDQVREKEWFALLTPSNLEFFLGWESREITHGNLQLLSSDFGVFFGLVFTFLFAFGVFRMQRSRYANALLVVFLLDALVTSSFQHLYLCVYFAMISMSLDFLESEREHHD